MRPIDADQLGLTDIEIIMCDGDYKEALKILIDKIEHAPPIEPKGKKGKWILYEKIKGFPDWICSECGGSGRGDYYYCPWCMAAME